jgi:beta-mannosidase
LRKIDLAGEWTLARWRADRETDDSGIPIRIPGDTFSALIAAGKIPDPYFGTNELDTLWVGRADWLLSRRVSIDPAFIDHRHVFLHIESLDTIAEIRINGRTAARSSNMFTVLRVDIGEYLKSGENRLEILLHSAEKRAAELSEQLPYPVPYSAYPVQSPHRNLVRRSSATAAGIGDPV